MAWCRSTFYLTDIQDYYYDLSYIPLRR